MIKVLFIITITGVIVSCTSSSYKRYQNEYETNQYSSYVNDELSINSSNTDGKKISIENEISKIEDQLKSAEKRWGILLSDESQHIGLNLIPDKKFSNLDDDQNLELLIKQKVDLSLLEAAVLIRNPDLKASRLKLAAGIDQYPQVMQLEDILKQYNAFTKQLMLKSSNMKHKDMQAMHFPAPGSLGLKGQIIDYDLKVRLLKLEEMQLNKISQLRNAFYNALFLKDALSKNKENIQLIEQNIKVVQKQIAAGKAMTNTVVMLQLELSMLNEAVKSLQENLQIKQSTINRLIDRQVDKPIVNLDADNLRKVNISKTDLIKTMQHSNQSLKIHDLMISKMETMLALNKKMAFPDPTTGNSYFEDKTKIPSGVHGNTFQSNRQVSPSKAADYPRRFAFTKELESLIKEKKNKRKAMLNKLEFNLEKVLISLENARRNIILHRKTYLPQANQAYETSLRAYKNGKTDFATYLSSQRAILKFQIGESKSVEKYKSTLFELEVLIGKKVNFPKTTIETLSKEKEVDK